MPISYRLAFYVPFVNSAMVALSWSLILFEEKNIHTLGRIVGLGHEIFLAPGAFFHTNEFRTGAIKLRRVESDNAKLQ